MTLSLKQLGTVCCVTWLGFLSIASFAQDLSQATTFPSGPDTDMTVKYFNREITTDGVMRESSYTEKMIRRKGHVWSQRILPGSIKSNAGASNHVHKDFNYIVLPRLVNYDGNKLTVKFIDTHERQTIYIAPTEYENINFDGSWLNTFYLVNPDYLAEMPVTSRSSAVTNTQWHELSKNGMFQRVLWNTKLKIPLIIETGDQEGNYLHRVEIRPSSKLAKNLPWNSLQGYTQKEYADFLD